MDTNEKGMMFQADPHFMGMDRFIIFFGVVEDRDDPIQVGRVRVRIYGVHPDDPELMPMDDLPWAYPIYPVTVAQTGGVGHGGGGVLPGSTVVGFFADGIDRQIPMYFGVVNGGAGRWNAGQSSSGQPGKGQPDTSQDGGAYNPEANGPSHTVPASAGLAQKGVQMAKNILSVYPKMKPHHAASICGNLMAEGEMSIPAVKEASRGGGHDCPDPTVGSGVGGVGYGWAQWTNPKKTPKVGRLTNFVNFCKSKAGDNWKEYAKTEEANRLFFLHEIGTAPYKSYREKMEQNSPITVTKGLGAYKGSYDLSKIEDCTKYWMAVYEVPAPATNHLSKRVQYAKDVLNGLQAGGNNGGTGGSVRGQSKPAVK